jgi:feruloyl-CoA synthase
MSTPPPPSAAEPLVLSRVDGAIATLELNRPHKRNAISLELVGELERLLGALPASVHVVVLAARGDHFSAGLDLSELREMSAAEGMQHSHAWYRVFEQLQFGSRPIVAALHGAVVGGGLELAACAHVRVADDSAYFGLPEGQRGIFLGGGGSVRVSKLIGFSRVTEMMLTGRVYDADDAFRIGLTHYTVARGGALAKAHELARRIAGNAAMSHFAILRALPLIAEQPMSHGLMTESLIGGIVQAEPEAKQRMRAFLDKRAAKVAPEAPPYRDVAFGPYETEVRTRADGSILLRAPQPLGAYPARFTEHLLHWAAARPDTTFIAMRERGGARAWQRLGYAETLARVRALAQALLDLGLSAERPLAVLSGNDIEHALLTLAAMHVGIPVAPVSPSYSLLDAQAPRVAHVMRLLTPGLVFAADGDTFAAALAHAVPPDVPLLLARGAAPAGRRALRFDALQATPPTAAVDAAHARVDGDKVAKFLFTSGSTGAPKAVINTHRMLAANQQMYAQCYPFMEETPPVLVDWLPWHHTAGGNSNIGLVLRNGGTMVIDEGRPTEDGIDETVRNLRDWSPTAIYTVPKGLEMLARRMEHDTTLRDAVFRDLRLVFAAGAVMPQAVIELVDRLAQQSLGCRVPMTMGLGMTETAPFAITHHRAGWRQGLIGLPAPGLEVKLAPVDGRLEIRYRGPTVTPGYWRQPELRAQAWDDEGYFRSGDAVAFVDPAQPALGLRFEGRIAENFKLVSGTWVDVNAVRTRALAAALPYVSDVAVAGEGRDGLGLLVFLAPAAATLAGAGGPLADDPGVRAWAQRWLDDLAAAGSGSSNRVQRVLLLAEPPSAARGELTDKGSLNQRVVLSGRAAAVEALYGDGPAVLRARAG